jgi:hypothetical protein
MHTIYFFKKIKLPHFEKYKVKDEISRHQKHDCAEYTGVIDHWKEHFVSSEMSMK